VMSGELFISDFAWNWTLQKNLLGQDIVYDLSSIAPTDSDKNTVSLKHIEYTAPSGTKTALLDTTPLPFVPAFEYTLSLPSSFEIGKSAIINGSGITNTTKPITADMVVSFIIGGGVLAQFENLESDTSVDCQGPTVYTGKCNWFVDGVRPSVIALGYRDNFLLSGSYIPKTAYPVLENVRSTGYIHYKLPDNFGTLIDVLYPTFNSTTSSEYREARVKIIGQNNALGEYGTIGTDKKTKQAFINTLRKNIALLGRNRTDYTGANYLISSTLPDVKNASFANKRTLISIGSDIHITENIDKHESPLAIIALTDEAGNGGNIIIDASVTDIHSSLFAEHAVMTDTNGTKQLFIFGSLISSNTLGDTIAKICPYHITNPCTEDEARKYDLEEMRKWYTGSGWSAISPTAQKYPSHALIIEYDIRVQSDPPPAVE
jgi:hypothetical protein